MSRRNLTQDEQTILSRLLSAPFPGNKELASQTINCKAEPTGDDDNYGSVYLFPEVKDVAPVSLRVPIEGLVMDAAGGEVNILLHVVDGLLHELEVVKLDGTPLSGAIDPDGMKVIVNK